MRVDLETVRDAHGRRSWIMNPGREPDRGQAAFACDLHSDTKAASAGNRSGKTHACVRDHLIKRMVNVIQRNSHRTRALYLPGLIVTPTLKDWRTTEWPSLYTAAMEAQLRPVWRQADNVVVYQALRSCYGAFPYAYTIIRSAEYPLAIKDFEVSDMYLAEFADMPERPDEPERCPVSRAVTRMSLEAPLRQDVRSGTPLAGPGNPMDRWFQSCDAHEDEQLPDGWAYYQWSTMDNEHNLAEGFIDQVKRGIPKSLVGSVLHGETTQPMSSRAYHCYTKANEDVDLVYQPQLPLMLTADWNVQPMVWGISQFKGRRWDTEIFVIGELVIDNNATAEEMARMALREIARLRHTGDVYFRGDPAGDARTPTSHVTAAKQARAILREGLGNRLHWKLRHKHSGQHDRLAVTNAMMETADGNIHILVNPKAAPFHSRDFYRVKVKPDGSLIKETKGPGKILTHASDGIAEACYDLWPSHIEEMEGRGARPMSDRQKRHRNLLGA